jgi:hypothetical protein
VIDQLVEQDPAACAVTEGRVHQLVALDNVSCAAGGEERLQQLDNLNPLRFVQLFQEVVQESFEDSTCLPKISEGVEFYDG